MTAATWALALALVLAIGAAPAGAMALDDVDPLIGTDATGATVPGPQTPFGFANPSPDTTEPSTAGYSPAGLIRGFSQTHVSGTGGASRYGNFRVTPLLGCPAGPAPPAIVPQRKRAERASPGYYAVTLEPSRIRVELTASRRVAVHRYTFPRKARRIALYLDVGSVVLDRVRFAQHATAQSARVTGPGSFSGSATVAGGWGFGSYTLRFAAAASRRANVLRVIRDGRDTGVVACFDTRRNRVVGLKIALSFRSAAAAQRTLRTETGGLDFAAVHARTRQRWRRALGAVDVDGGTRRQRVALATALYHAEVMPHDLTGENVWWTSAEPHYEDLYALWDTFRTVNPLLTLIAPGREAGIVRSLLDTARHEGGLPDARVAGNDGITQVGSSADVVIADAIVKHLPGFSRNAALAALLHDARTSSPHPLTEGRALDEYTSRGYMSNGLRASVSRTLEYSYDDFAVGEAAGAMGDSADALTYLARSRSWRNLWDPTTRTVRPRETDGVFSHPFSPTVPYHTWLAAYYEGSALEWSTFVPHDVDAVVRRVGGPRGFVAWLDRLFASRRGGYDPGNEPDLLAPWLYVHAGRPDLTDARVRRLLATAYGAGPGGLPGNDDSGTLSAWYAWGAIGLFPNAGQPYYYVGAPLFRRTVLHLAGGRTFTISAPATSGRNRYVVAARLDGAPLCRAFVTHDEVAPGGTLELTMGARPSGWGRCELPPLAPGRRLSRTGTYTQSLDGDVAEWLRSGLQSRVHRFDSGRRLFGSFGRLRRP